MLVNNISNKSFIPKLNVNSLSTKNFNVDNSGNIYGVSLYINNQLIDFSSYLTASYLTNYVTTSYLTSQLSNYVLSSTLSNYTTISYVNSQLSNYASNGALSSYRLISDSYAKWEVDNMVAGLSAGIAANGVAITGVVVSLAATNATVTGLVGSVATLDSQVATLQSKTVYQNTGAGLSGAYTQFTNNLNISNGISNVVELKNTGEVITSSCSTNNLNSVSGTLNISTSGGNINIGGLASTIYINGFPYTPFNVFSGFSQW